MKNLFVISLLLVVCACYAQPINSFSDVDEYARNTPSNLNSIEALAAYFDAKATSPIEKSRMVYVWLAENIKYDDAGYNSKKLGDNSAEGVLKSKVAVCEGFANLYQVLGEKLGLEILKIVGCAKGYDYESDMYDNIEESTNHAWNAIKIDGKWSIYDATWGSGAGESNSKGKLVSIKKFNSDWFNVDPKVSIYSHFPLDNIRQFLETPISFERFVEMPKIIPVAFNQKWLNVDEVMLLALSKKTMDFAEFFPVINQGTIQAPSNRLLKKKTPYTVKIISDEIDAVSLINSDEEWFPFQKNNDEFSYTFQVKAPGEYSIVAKKENNETYVELLKYQFE